jgi:hypothetical protein
MMINQPIFKLSPFLSTLEENPYGPWKLGAIINNASRPPLVFRQKDSGQYWMIVAGPNYYDMLDTWRVSTIGPAGAEDRCTIHFRPDVNFVVGSLSPAVLAAGLLPPAVRRLERLLDESMGQDDGGTLKPISRLRWSAGQAWINVAMRPWALGERRGPYNTRAEVDENLEAWSRKGASYRRLHREILRQYPLAEQALGRFYQQSFHLTPDAAKEQAAWALDIAFRWHYTFHSDDRHSYFRDTNSPNPWRWK